MERISVLPKPQQKFVIQGLEPVVAQVAVTGYQHSRLPETAGSVGLTLPPKNVLHS
jgi:hypothetical protein